ncbi:ATP-dependent DNA helicase [Planococcus lenghuensis]|uniref:ATP-dependent helicase n=1 Tax=Planococcus lenghuensis TaxID=2213202 RepID=A0A1Q2KZH6_9BACL|nr:ATP-dependent DNA helicase [Planococcus lenghuensis]AQQ53591.1 ATP-dependent helicase [Planococcus lenghuensis]
MKQSMPFPLSKEKTFFESLNDWIGDIFYDELPEKGYELRDEQIFMAFQVEQALKEKSVLFAEAGVGTGKTLAYLLPAIAYARYTGKPALIACADETLIDQLIKKGGDLDRLDELFGLNLDVRTAKSRDQYLCLQRLEAAQKVSNEEFLEDVEVSLPDFVFGNGSMQSIHPYGDRSDYPELTDDQWQQINYHPVYNCSACELRNRCGQTLHRKAYREATDLVICSHDFLMEHLWTKEARVREGQSPLLPETSLIVLDEGHLLEFAAQRALTHEVQENTLVNVTDRLMSDGVRVETLQLIEQAVDLHSDFFRLLRKQAEDSGEDRRSIRKSPELLQLGKTTVTVLEAILEELVFESELYTIPEYDLRIAEEYFEQYIFSMNLFTEEGDAVNWFEEKDGTETLVIMPRLVTDILQEKLFNGHLPIVFSSATLSVQKNFNYIAASLGIDDYQAFSVPSPFDYADVMKIRSHPVLQEEKQTVLEQLLAADEQTLILFRSRSEMAVFKETISPELQKRIEFEGDRELSAVVRDFQEKKFSILCSYHLWEGLDLPGDMLTKVVIVDLPYPPKDPVFDAKRKFAANPIEEIDLPFMQLRLQQGIGRLIRTSRDKGIIHLLLNEEEWNIRHLWEPVLPVVPVNN